MLDSGPPRLMALRESEIKCRDSFDAFLRGAAPALSPRWEDGDDPPDLDLFIDEQQFAVEVTTVIKKERLGKVELPLRVVVTALQAVVEDAERTVRDANLLRGTFVAQCPRPIANLEKRRIEIVARIWDAVGRLWSAPPGTKAVFLRESGRTFLVTRVSEEGSALYLGGPTPFIWRGDAADELQALVEERMSVKVELLSKIPFPKILLLDERYPFADAEMYAEMRCPKDAIEQFAAIFVVRIGVPSILLHSSMPGLRGVWDRPQGT